MNSFNHKRCFLILICTFILILKGSLCDKIHAEESEPKATYIYAKPDLLTQEKISNEIMGGLLGGVIIAIAGGCAGTLYDTHLHYGVVVPPYRSGYAMLGILIGYSTGNAIGVYIVGNRYNETGSFPATWIGATLGPIIGAGTGALLHNFLHLSGNYLTGVGFITGPTLGSIIGFNSTRKKRIPIETNDALLKFKDSEMSFGIPQINFTYNRDYNIYYSKEEINLLEIRF